jgi:hypothetical protein
MKHKIVPRNKALQLNIQHRCMSALSLHSDGETHIEGAYENELRLFGHRSSKHKMSIHVSVTGVVLTIM